ncbi:MAG: hypothetical protein IIB38_16965, partial [Candidatus Hydrogenedentes bacterium]|nr:hypothetical protein [Candidatus Hydrogenedentota bacterium]
SRIILDKLFLAIVSGNHLLLLWVDTEHEIVREFPKSLLGVQAVRSRKLRKGIYVEKLPLGCLESLYRCFEAGEAGCEILYAGVMFSKLPPYIHKRSPSRLVQFR